MSLLVIRISGVKNEEEECAIIDTQARMYGLETKTINPKTTEELVAQMETDEPYDYVYLSAHGNNEGFASNDNTIDLSWVDFSILLCESGAFKENSVLMLSCCYAGLNRVAYDLFYGCPEICYVVGPRKGLESKETHIAYSNFLYLTVHKDLDPVLACKKIENGLDIRLFFSERLAVETETAFLWHTEHLNTIRQPESGKMDEDVIKESPIKKEHTALHVDSEGGLVKGDQKSNEQAEDS